MANLLKHKSEKMLIFDQKILEVAIGNIFIDDILISILVTFLIKSVTVINNVTKIRNFSTFFTQILIMEAISMLVADIENEKYW